MSEKEQVNMVAHYNGDACLQAIKTMLGAEGYIAWLRGTIVKYQWRLDKKDLPEQDAKKADWYSKRLVEALGEKAQIESWLVEPAPEPVSCDAPIDRVLLQQALFLLEEATYHDGRYGQLENSTWQSPAQKLVGDIAAHLRCKPYEGFGDPPTTTETKSAQTENNGEEEI